ncbi:MAG: O-antigen polymerase [candidate division Zixibacteria bacterium RBG-1]|nr:MAG: O-antigen polymerase [candidate division Zixibacteria bacterium RBG-1]OGC85339.1 MAG: hypothetical protein A2V73_08970 [candidate division Zixibacteria bacterium RBG_19FT_COMBO_42_43]
MLNNLFTFLNQLNKEGQNIFLSISFLTLLSGTLVGISFMFLSDSIDNPAILILTALAIPLAYLLVVKFSEVSFALFLLAGFYKGDPRLEFLPQFLDLTVLFGLLSVAGIFYALIKKGESLSFPPKNIFLTYGLLVFMGLISLTYTSAPTYGTEKFLRFVTITSLAFLSPFTLFKTAESIKRFFVIFILLASSMLLDLFLQGISPVDFYFRTAFGSDYLALARIQGIAFIFVFFYFLLSSKSLAVKLINLALIFPLLFGIYISGGRAPALALSITLVVTMVLVFLASFGRQHRASQALVKRDFKIIGSILIIIFLGISLLAYFSDYFSTFIHRTILLIERSEESSPERVDMYTQALRTFLSFPYFLSGTGIGGFTVSYAGFDDKRGIYPHNIFLEMASELGFLGLLAIFLLIFWSLKDGFSLFKRNQDSNSTYLSLTLLALFIFLLLNSLVSGDINDNRILFASMALIQVGKKIL